MYTELNENNSGGSFWLTKADYDKLHAAGWVGEGITEDYFAGRKIRREGVSRRVALAEFQDITGWDPDEEGCNCCGQPFYFSSYDDDGKSIW